jgi:ketosteroid isomerase-like protein
MTTQANMNLIQRFWQASERGNIDEMAAFWAPDAINHGGQTRHSQRRPPTGPEGLKRVFRIGRVFPLDAYPLLCSAETDSL